MVRRLVQQEQVRIARHGPREQHAALLATAQAVERSVGSDARLSKNGFGMAIAHGIVRMTVPRHARHHNIADGPVQVRGNLLHHAGDLESGLLYDFARVRFHLARKHLEQRALALAVTAYKANAVTRLDVERDIVQERRAAKAEQDILCGKNRHRKCNLEKV